MINTLLLRHAPEYIAEVLGVELVPPQRSILDALLARPRVMVLSGHAVGKSLVAAAIINLYYDAGYTVVSTAPTQAQVERILWRYVRQLRRGSGMPPRAPMIVGRDRLAIGYTARDATSFQGIHAEHMLIVFDECVGIPDEFWDAAEGMMPGADCRWLAIGNPTTTSSRAYREAQSGMWHVIHLPSTAVTLYGVPGMADDRWIRDCLARWAVPDPDGQYAYDGTHYRVSPDFEARVLGRWPSQDSMAILGAADLAIMFDTPPSPADEQYTSTETVIGVDVALFGSDHTAICVRRNRRVVHLSQHHGWDIDMIDHYIREELVPKYRPDRIVIDADGIGSALKRPGRDYIPFHASSRARVDADYADAKTEVWFRMAADKPYCGDIDPALRHELRSQLAAHRWSLSADGRRKLEPKDRVRQRLGGKSPDLADALAYTYYRPTILTVY